MRTMQAVLGNMTFQDFAKLAEQAERERLANERLAVIEAAQERKAAELAERERAELLKIGRPEYHTLAGARLKHAQDMAHQAILHEIYGSTLHRCWKNNQRENWKQVPLFEGVIS